MRTALAAGLLSLCLFACPKGPTTTVMGSDDEQMDRYASQLEEIRTRGEVDCKDACSLKGKVCDISSAACAIAGKNADRDDFQKKCVTSQEDCASFNEKCSTCSK
ncbi:MAG: hypothetical protein IT380_11695 [Myxococcales bacterium]|nr:hypothetical protein [Myxococcales bacterium]